MSSNLSLITSYIGKDLESSIIEKITRKQIAMGESHEKAARTAKRAYEEQAEAAEQYRSKLDLVGNSLLAVGAAGTSFSVSGIRAAINMQGQIKAMEALTGSTAEARKQFEFFDQRASKSKFNLTELVSAGRLMMALRLETARYLPVAEDLAAMKKILLIVAFLAILLGCGNQKPADGWLDASSNLWTGVKLYHGPNRAYAFEVLGGNEKHRMLSGQIIRGVKVRYPNGSEEWKDRSYIINSEQYFVRADDPALQSMRWQTLSN